MAGYHCGNDINNGSDNIFDEQELDPCLEDNSPADFPEMLPATDVWLGPGDLAALEPDGTLARSSRSHQTSVVGVVSTRPSYLGNSRHRDSEGWVPVALVGIVPVKVTTSNGPVRAGHLLTASNRPGHAMRARGDFPAGSVVGKALGFLVEGTGKIRMLVINR